MCLQAYQPGWDISLKRVMMGEQTVQSNYLCLMDLDSRGHSRMEKFAN